MTFEEIEMSENVDLSFVSPFVRDIVVKRIEAIEQFSTKPGRKEAERHATDLGLKVAQFYKLVTKWQQTHDPVTLAPKGNPRPHRVKMTREQLDFIDPIIAQNRSMPVRSLVNLIRIEAAREQFDLPPVWALRKRIGRDLERPLPSAISENFDLIFDHAVIDVPVDFGDRVVQMPLCTFLIDVRNESVVGIHLSKGLPNEAGMAEAMLDALRRNLDLTEPSNDALRFGVPVTVQDPATQLRAAVRKCGQRVIERPVGMLENGMLVRCLKSDRCNGLSFFPRKALSTKARRSAKGKGMTPEQAHAFVAARLPTEPSAIVTRLPIRVRIDFETTLDSVRQTK
ncbi:hypothetical protein C7W88_17850 (plasmid) [Novosphingobium sp. THN1]|nr:hypothetical protein C7W88_17850 [Novosphingobium sp. THN1]